MGTLRDLLNASYRTLGVIDQSEQMDANQETCALYALDTLTDSLSNERLMIYKFQPYTFVSPAGRKIVTLGPAIANPGQVNNFQLPALNPGTGYVNGKYVNVPITGGSGTGLLANITVVNGSVVQCSSVVGKVSQGINYVATDQLSCSNTHLGGSGSGFVITPSRQPDGITTQTDWVVTRPMKIEKAYTNWNGDSVQQEVDIPIGLSTMEQYSAIGVKNMASTFAFTLYDDNDWPVRRLTMFPVPNQDVMVTLWLRQPLVLAEASMLDQPVDFPNGYERMFRYNLAVELAPEFNKPITQEVAKAAIDSKEKLMSQNQAPFFMQGDGSLSQSSQGLYNWINGYPALQINGGRGFWGG